MDGIEQPTALHTRYGRTHGFFSDGWRDITDDLAASLGERQSRAAVAVEPTRKMAIAATRIAAKILGGNIPDDEAEKIGRLLLKAAADAALESAE